MSKGENNKSSTVLPASADEVPVRGQGGLKKSLLTATLFPLFFIAVFLVTAGSFIYSRSFQKTVKNDLENVAETILLHYDSQFPGDYNLLIDNNKNTSYLLKGDTNISDDQSYIDSVSEKTGMQISLFFYDTRMMTTLKDGDGERLIGTLVNNNIVKDVLEARTSHFYRGLMIEGKKYCVEYIPIFSQNGTCLGMIGVAQAYDLVQKNVNGVILSDCIIMIMALVVMGLCMIKYTNGLVESLMKIRSFLEKIAEGNLDTELNMKVVARKDEIGDMGRLTNFLRTSLKKLVEKDPLTNLNNRRSGMQKIDQIRNKSERLDKPYAIAMGDIDFFKKVNDTYGHDAGDAVLKRVALIVSNAMAGHGTVIRWGGEEFLFGFENATEEDAKQQLINILEQIRQTVVEYENREIRFTMSYGVISGSLDRSAQEDITMADDRLYYAKKNGRNRVVGDAEYVEET